MKKIDKMTKKFFDELPVSNQKKVEIYEAIVNKKEKYKFKIKQDDK